MGWAAHWRCPGVGAREERRRGVVDGCFGGKRGDLGGTSPSREGRVVRGEEFARRGAEEKETDLGRRTRARRRREEKMRMK